MVSASPRVMRAEPRPAGDPLIRAISGRLPVILTEVTNLLGRGHPDYASFLAREFDQVLSTARDFVLDLLERAVAERARVVYAGSSAPAAGAGQTLFEEIGRSHSEQGQDVAGLLAACRMGGFFPHEPGDHRGAWRSRADAVLACRRQRPQHRGTDPCRRLHRSRPRGVSVRVCGLRGVLRAPRPACRGSIGG